MFENIGGKIKGLAVLMCWLGIIGSVILAFVLWSENSYYNPTIGLGIAVLVGGCLISWISSFATYALGEITENSERQVEMLNRLCEEQKKMNENMSQFQKMMASDNRAVRNEEPRNISSYLPEL